MRHLALSASLILIVALFITDVPATARLVEVTFDDEDDGAGAQNGHPMVDNLQNNFASLGQGYLAVELTGSARRSGFEEGWYGRAAELPDGQGAVRIHDWDLTALGQGASIGMWVQARDRSAGRLFHVQDVAALSLSDGELVVEVWDALGDVAVLPTTISWPDDGAFHYLGITLRANFGTILAEVVLDFEVRAEVAFVIQPPASDAVVTLGDGFVGLIDELLVAGDWPGDHDRWDVDPNAECPEGLTCLEEVIDLIPNGLSHRVPVRMKGVVDAAACSADSPCPLLLVVSGGGKCADDYAPRDAVEYYAREGFVAVTVDPYCEGDAEFDHYPMETSQLVAAKNHLMSGSPLAPRIDGPEYAATGCSHGCNSVTHLMMFEEDYPHRTFGNSCSLDWMICAYAAGVLCPATEEYLEQRVIDLIGSLDWEHPLASEHYGQMPISALTPRVAATREFAAAWGLNLEGDVCTAEGRSTCLEESMWGMTYGSRRIRDLWQRLEPQDAPTGYFVENHEADCQHCATLDSPAFRCGVCLLKHGRLGMELACPECLTYEDVSIDPGADALECPVEASWYVDPLTFRTDVRIDVRPATQTDVVNLFSPLPFPLAILGSDTVDVDAVDLSSLALGPAGATPVFDLTIPFVYFLSRRDVNRDDWPDLVAWFLAAETGIALGETDLCLKGRIEGADFVACDAVYAIEWACGLGVELLLLLPLLAGARAAIRRIRAPAPR